MNQAREALSALVSAEYARARDLYGNVLEIDPNDQDAVCGFYTASYWENRVENFAGIGEGRPRATALVQSWDQFETLANEKEFTGYSSFRAAMKSVLSQAAAEFRKSFQESGLNYDTKVLCDLGKCLIRIEDYPNAIEILQFARRIRSGSDVLFLLAEATCASSGSDAEALGRGLGFYRDAFVIDPTIFDTTLVASSIATEVFERLYAEKENDREAALLWFPASLMAMSMKPTVRKLLTEEVREISAELGRLTQDLERVVEKYRERVRARICFFILVLIQFHQFHEYDEEGIQELETKLAELEPELYKHYRDHV